MSHLSNRSSSSSSTSSSSTSTSSQQQHQRLMFRIEGVTFDDVNNLFVGEAETGISFSTDEKDIIMYVLENKSVNTAGGSYNYKNIGSQFNLFVRYNKC
jgi:hypothetical protein